MIILHVPVGLYISVSWHT